MKKMGIIVGLACFALAGNGFAKNVSFIAKSAQPEDTCYMTAKVITLTETSGNAISGVMFRAFSPDGDRLDVNCPNFGIKLKHNNEVFVSGFTADDLNQCQFNEYSPASGTDGEEHMTSSGKFIAIELNTTVRH